MNLQSWQAIHYLMNLKIKQIYNAIKEVQLSIARRVECVSDDTGQQMRQDLEICEFFNLQLDESTDVCDASQLLVFIWSSMMARLRRSC
jgi:hypothetical protein